MGGHRLEHLNEALHHKLSAILAKEARDPRFGSVTITGVELARDHSFAKVHYACYRQELVIGELTDSLNRAAGFFSQALGRTLATRQTPRLRFYHDGSFDYANRIERLLAELGPHGIAD